MEEVISLQGVGKSFGKKNILENINFSINKGELIGLIGRSGSGKSILIKMIIDFLKPDKGNIIRNIPKEKINFSMQGNSIYEYLTVRQNLMYFSKMYGLNKRERKEIIAEVIDKLALKEFENVIIKNLSGGTQKRVDIACSLLNNPEVILMDEPFLGLDPELVNKIGTLMIKLNENGKTILISSHDIKTLSLICKKFFLIRNKEIDLVKREKLGESYR